MLIIAICIAECIILLIMLNVHLVLKRRERKRMIQAVRAIMRKNKLNEKIGNKSHHDETRQLNKVFVCLEFLRTKPRMIWAFDPGQAVSIGRGRSNMVQLQNAGISREHCRISESEGWIFLQNLKALNAPYIKRGILRRRIYVERGGYEVLKNRDVIVIADFKLKVTFVWGREAFVS